jgi:hypothetical protein
MKWFLAFAAAMLALMAFGITMSIRQSTQEDSACRAAGGHIVVLGQDWICVGDDGRVIEP